MVLSRCLQGIFNGNIGWFSKSIGSTHWERVPRRFENCHGRGEVAVTSLSLGQLLTIDSRLLTQLTLVMPLRCFLSCGVVELRRGMYNHPNYSLISIKILRSPVIGGVFSNPSTRWPEVFGKVALLKQHPYLLPCMVAGGIAFFTFVIGFLGLKEASPIEHRYDFIADTHL